MAYPVMTAGHLEMATNESESRPLASGSGAPRNPGGMARWFLRAPLRKQPWLSSIYLVIQFPIAIAAFVYGVVMLSLGAGLVVLALVGVPILVAFLYSLQPYGELQRGLSNALVGTRIPALRFRNAGPWWTWRQIRARLASPMSWRVLLFLFVQFPMGIAGFVVVTVLFALPFGFATAPLVGETGGDFLWVDSWAEGLPFVAVSPIVALACLNLLQGAGWVSGLVNRLFLEMGAGTAVDDGPTVLERARAAVGAWSNPGAPVVLDDGLVAEAGIAPERAHQPADQGLTVDVAMRRVSVNGKPVELTPKEFDLLALFAQNPGRPFSRDELLDRIWRNDYEVTDRTIDTHVQRLRKKLGRHAGVIQTVWGVGYRFEDGAKGAPEATEEAADEERELGKGW
jgi:DNA-binding winged helix-turn-helix (wHTH) protein